MSAEEGNSFLTPLLAAFCCCWGDSLVVEVALLGEDFNFKALVLALILLLVLAPLLGLSSGEGMDDRDRMACSFGCSWLSS